MKINEIFYSLQGEGVRAGTPNVFVRFAKCNLKCAMKASAVSPGGWVCDTEFDTYTEMEEDEILRVAIDLVFPASVRGVGVIFTGGEPALQLTLTLIKAFKKAGFVTAIETNGTIDLGERYYALDWVCVSPKVPFERLKQLKADEFKFVVTAGEPLPDASRVSGAHWLLSPAFAEDGTCPKANVDHAIALVKANPLWRLSYQTHKTWGIR